MVLRVYIIVAKKIINCIFFFFQKLVQNSVKTLLKYIINGFALHIIKVWSIYYNVRVLSFNF